MPRKPNDLAQAFADREANAAKLLREMPRPGVRDLPVVWGLDPRGTTLQNVDNVLHDIAQILVDSGKVFVWDHNVVMEVGEDGEKRLITLAIDRRPQPAAAAWLGNLFKCRVASNKGVQEFLPNTTIAGLVLSHAPTIAELPRMRLYSRRPMFDKDYRLLTPGWHADVGILVHGPSVDLEQGSLATINSSLPAKERLPPRLRELLGDFCFRSDADLANALSVLVTGMLITSFIDDPHPVVVIDGNQAGLGKSLLAMTIGTVLDGCDQDVIAYNSNDAELEKRILSQLLKTSQTTVILDNAKVGAGREVSSAFVEARSTASRMSSRILGGSELYERPNDLLWFLTMNGTRLSEDLTDRQLPIRLFYEGQAGGRQFEGRNPIATARRYRSEILAELAGMIVAWNQRARPLATRNHRLNKWVQIVGGILECNGFPEFLANLQTAAAEFNNGLDDLVALVEKALATKQLYFTGGTLDDSAETVAARVREHGQPASKWTALFRDSKVLADHLEATKSESSKGKWISNFLTKYINRAVTVRRGDREVAVVLRKAAGRSNSTHYCFQVVDQTQDATDQDDGAANPQPTTLPALGLSKSHPRDVEATRPTVTVPQAILSTTSVTAVEAVGAGNAEAW